MENQNVLVIGGSSGIGREIGRQAHDRGAAVTITGRDPQRLAAIAIGAIQTVVVDAHDEAALDLLFAETDTFDHIVSMVGDSMAGGFLATTPQTMRHVLHSQHLWAPKRPSGGRPLPTNYNNSRTASAK